MNKLNFKVAKTIHEDIPVTEHNALEYIASKTALDTLVTYRGTQAILSLMRFATDDRAPDILDKLGLKIVPK